MLHNVTDEYLPLYFKGDFPVRSVSDQMHTFNDVIGLNFQYLIDVGYAQMRFEYVER